MRPSAAIERTIRSYGGLDLARIWASIALSVARGTPVHVALDQLRKNQPGLFSRD